MRHTPGPYTDCFEGNTVLVVGGPHNDDLAEFFHYDEATVSVTREEAEANARLFIAASDLLLAVQCLCDEMADYMKINHLGDPNEKHNYRLGMAAIAKATTP